MRLSILCLIFSIYSVLNLYPEELKIVQENFFDLYQIKLLNDSKYVDYPTSIYTNFKYKCKFIDLPDKDKLLIYCPAYSFLNSDYYRHYFGSNKTKYLIHNVVPNTFCFVIDKNTLKCDTMFSISSQLEFSFIYCNEDTLVFFYLNCLDPSADRIRSTSCIKVLLKDGNAIKHIPQDNNYGTSRELYVYNQFPFKIPNNFVFSDNYKYNKNTKELFMFIITDTIRSMKFQFHSIDNYTAITEILYSYSLYDYMPDFDKSANYLRTYKAFDLENGNTLIPYTRHNVEVEGYGSDNMGTGIAFFEFDSLGKIVNYSYTPPFTINKLYNDIGRDSAVYFGSHSFTRYKDTIYCIFKGHPFFEFLLKYDLHGNLLDTNLVTLHNNIYKKQPFSISHLDLNINEAANWYVYANQKDDSFHLERYNSNLYLTARKSWKPTNSSNLYHTLGVYTDKDDVYFFGAIGTSGSGYIKDTFYICKFKDNSYISIDEEPSSLPNNISIYPNPTSNYLDVSLAEVCSKITAEVLDLEGKSLFKLDFENEKDFQIKFPFSLPDGTYTLSLTTDGKQTATSFVIAK